MTSFEIEQLRAEREAAIAQAELEEWIDSQPEPETGFKPCCRQCKYFDASGDLDGINGLCRAKTYREFHDNGALTLCLKREATDDICDRYIEVLPF